MDTDNRYRIPILNPKLSTLGVAKFYIKMMKADCREYEKIPLRYPPGMERRNQNGETLYALLQRNLYGSPAAPRRWCETRNTWML